jgi:hypothetical protein
MLSNATARIYQKNPLVRQLVAQAKSVEKADPFTDPLGFEAHMLFEEMYIRPHMTVSDQTIMNTQHRVIRSRNFTRAFFDAHARWEEHVFSTLGR